jgi:hypothetical protein
MWSSYGSCQNYMLMSSGNFLDSSNLLNTWYHLTTVLSGTTAAIYVNGVQTANRLLSANIDIQRTNNKIGSDGASASNVAIDELKFYNRALSESEILTDYQTNGPIA